MPLREKKPEQEKKEEKPGLPVAAGEEDSKKEESKEQVIPKKEEISYDVGSEVDQSDDEHKKADKKRQEKELDQVIYITISETPTNILFYCPSTKYLNLKNGKYIIFLILNFLKYRGSNCSRKD